VGYGGILLHLLGTAAMRAVRGVGLDLAPSGLALLAELAAAESLRVETGVCDLGSPELTGHRVPEGALVYTSYATSCVPSIGEDFIARVAAWRPRAVVHFEPFYEHAGGESLLDMLRRRYIQVNGYNREFLGALKRQEAAGRIEIVEERPAVFGVNPLFAASVVAWRPR
jgi:hypothetical protein